MNITVRQNTREEVDSMLDQLPDNKLVIVAEILKGMQNDRNGGLSDKKRDAINELVELVRPSLNVGIDEIREIVAPIAQKYELEKMYLFGSRARGDNRPDSDYDFMVSFGEQKVGLITYCGLVDDLEDAFQAHVDVITNNAQDDSILDAAKIDGVLIYDRAR